MALSQDFAQDLQAYFEGNTDMPAAPATYYLALHTADPTKTVAVAEMTGDGYARAVIDFSSATTASTEDIDNTSAIIFPTATGTSGSPMTHYSVWDALSGGNAYLYAPLDASVPWNSGASVAFAIGAIKMEFLTVPVSSYSV